MTKIISIINHKGGVGKTTTTLNLGAALALWNKKVLIVDNDPQHNLTQAFQLDHYDVSMYDMVITGKPLAPIRIKDNLEILPSSLDYSKAESELQGEQMNGYFKLKDALEGVNGYDYILIDCPPTLGILTMNAIIASKSVLIIVESEYFSLNGLQTILELIHSTKKRLNTSLGLEGLLITKTNNTVFKKDIEKAVRKVYSEKVFNTAIRQNISITEAPSKGKDIFGHAPKSHGAEDYMNLAKEILKSNG